MGHTNHTQHKTIDRWLAATPDNWVLAGEPALSDLLQDPITRSLMSADHVEDRDIEALLQKAQRHLWGAAATSNACWGLGCQR
jgi:hypothetical protein